MLASTTNLVIAAFTVAAASLAPGRTINAVYAASHGRTGRGLKVVDDEPEAEIVCGLLRSAGIECGFRETDRIDTPLEDLAAFGQREILVHPSDLEAARALLGEGEAPRPEGTAAGGFPDEG